MENATQPVDQPASPKLPVAVYLAHESKNDDKNHAPCQEFNSKPCPETVACSAIDKVKDSIVITSNGDNRDGHKKYKYVTPQYPAYTVFSFVYPRRVIKFDTDIPKRRLKAIARFPLTETASQDFEHIGSWILEKQPRESHAQPSQLLSQSGTVQSENYSMNQYLGQKLQDELWNGIDDSDTEGDKSKGTVNREPEAGDVLTTSSEDMKKQWRIHRRRETQQR